MAAVLHEEDCRVPSKVLKSAIAQKSAMQFSRGRMLCVCVCVWSKAAAYFSLTKNETCDPWKTAWRILCYGGFKHFTGYPSNDFSPWFWIFENSAQAQTPLPMRATVITRKTIIALTLCGAGTRWPPPVRGPNHPARCAWCWISTKPVLGPK